MNLFPEILKNTILQIAGKVLSVLIGVASIALITRSLGVADYGHYTTIINYLLIVGVLIDGGLHLTMIQLTEREAEQSAKEKIIQNILTLRLISAGVALSLGIIVAWFLPYTLTVKIGIIIISFSTLFNGIIQLLTGIFQMQLKMIAVIKAEIYRSLFYLFALLTIFYFFPKNLYLILITMALSYGLNVILLLKNGLKYFQLKLAWDKNCQKQILRYAWPLAISVIFNLMYLRTDVFVLSLTRSPEEVGLYGLSYKFLDILTMMAPLLMGVVLPILSRHWQRGEKTEFTYYFQQSFNLFSLFAFPIVAGVMVTAPQIINWISGAEFLGAANILRLLIWAIIALFIGGLASYTIVAINQQKTMMWVYGATALISLATYIYFIPIYGYWAAGIITIISEMIIAIASYGIVLRVSKIKLNWAIAVKSLLAAGVMGACLFALNFNHLLANIVLGIIIYIVTLLALGALQWRQLKHLKMMLIWR
ncbi:MAG TPA: oligosaccharide flippase family protein [bacterium]|nr:oligosaccharide flippase family protein [bacterium]